MGAMQEKLGAVGARVRPMLTHAAIYVWDLQKMAGFYETVLGLVRTDQGRATNAPVELIFFTNDASEHHQFVLVTGRPKDVKFSVVNQLSFLVNTLAEVREAHRRAVGMGATVKRCVSHGNAWSVYIEDPEGNVVEVYTHTPWYVPQPHLDLIDINKSDEDIYRETEALCRKDPAFCTREEWVARTTERLKK
jgi:catechol 2,3-dioxygenase